MMRPKPASVNLLWLGAGCSLFLRVSSWGFLSFVFFLVFSPTLSEFCEECPELLLALSEFCAGCQEVYSFPLPTKAPPIRTARSTYYFAAAGHSHAQPRLPVPRNVPGDTGAAVACHAKEHERPRQEFPQREGFQGLAQRRKEFFVRETAGIPPWPIRQAKTKVTNA
jgi:hypothetical protein